VKIFTELKKDEGSSELINSFQAIAPLTAHEKGAYFPQKLTPKSSTETEYKLFQKHVPSY
jgi:hypothetical protein